MLLNRKSNYYLRLFFDLLLLNISFIIAASLAISFNILMERKYMFILMLVMNLIWYIGSTIIKFYEDFEIRDFAYQFTNILKNVSVQTLTSIIFVFVTKEDLFNRNFTFIYTILLIILVSLRTELLKRILTKVKGNLKNAKNLVIIGGTESGNKLFRIIKDHSEFGYNFLGFVGGDPEHTGSTQLGEIEELEKIITDKNVEEVIIALDLNSGDLIKDIMRICNIHSVRTHIVPDYFKFLSTKFQIGVIGDIPIISVRSEPLAESHWKFIKRAFDIFFSFLVTVFILSWGYLLIGLIIKLTSRGPVIFKQERWGKNNRKFTALKFRSMVVESRDVDKHGKYQQAYLNDPRITEFGKFLRRTSLDELPQFINVFRGEMSVVGPRPHPTPLNLEYKGKLELYMLRHFVKPGITGWAQVNGFRGETKEETLMEKRIESDLWYIENWSFWLDIQIILLTIWQMIRGHSPGI